MSMKKICYITTSVATLKSFIFPTVDRLQAGTGWEIFSISDGTNADDIPENVRFLPVKMRRGINLDGIAAIVRMYRIFRREKFDMIQYSTPNAALYASIAGWLARVPVRLYCEWGLVYVSMKGIKRKLFKLEEKLVCRLSTWVEPDSHCNLNFAHKEGLYPEEKGSVVGAGGSCGVCFDKFDISQKPVFRADIRRQLAIPEDSFVYGFVGRVTRDKGINEMLAAFKRTLERDETAYLLIVGVVEGAQTLDRELYSWSKNERHVCYTGDVPDVERYVSAMDCFLLPSYREGFGLVTVEAEAMEVPVIVSEIPGPLDAMLPGITGKTVTPGSSEDLFEAMCAIRTEDFVLMGKKGREFVTENFDRNKLVDQIIADRIALMDRFQRKKKK